MSTLFQDPRGDVAILGAGCFWCIDAVLREVRGVIHVESGYSNGKTSNPSYEEVCEGDTGHNEVVRVVFDPVKLGFKELLGLFFSLHDPTSLNRQGNDVGTQYRSGIYTTSDAQHAIAKQSIAELTAQKVWPRPMVTEVLAADNYWTAEAYHQNYFALHPNQGYCAIVVAPKLAKFRQQFSARLTAA